MLIYAVLPLAVALALFATLPTLAQEGRSREELFKYRRDDSAPDGLTSIQIKASSVGPAPIEANVFGNFLEHLGGVIYEGVWANALQNPALERTEDNQTMPPWWDTAGATQWSGRIRGYRSPRAVQLRDGSGTLSQRIFLPVHRVRSFMLTFQARVPQGSGKLTVALRDSEDTNGPVVWQKDLTIASQDWKEQRLTLEAPAPITRGQASRLVFAHSGGDPVEVDFAELFPTDAVDGIFDPDVIQRAREWRIPTLRYAGNFSSGYHWRDGIGPRADRPTLPNLAWGGVESNHFGTDEFLRFCELIHAVPQIAVNAGSGTPQDAADWVRYVNKKMGSRRRPALWEIGNELYGGWQIGFTDPRGNAQRFVAFRDAMLEADAKLQFIATGKADEYSPEGLQRSHNWNLAVLQAAHAAGRDPEYLSLHPLVSLPGNLSSNSYEEQFESAMAHPTYVERVLLPSVIATLREVQGPTVKTRLAPNEWGIIIGGDRWWEGPNHDALSGALFNALTLNAFLRHSDTVTLANMTAFMHGGGIKKPAGVVIVDPQYYTQQLYARAEPRHPVAVEWSGPGRDVPRRGFMPDVAGVPDIDVFAALSSDRKRLVAFVINRSLKDARPIRLRIRGFPVGEGEKVSATVLTGPDSKATNTWEKPDTVAPAPFPLPPSGVREPLTIPPHSLVVFHFSR